MWVYVNFKCIKIGSFNRKRVKKEKKETYFSQIGRKINYFVSLGWVYNLRCALSASLERKSRFRITCVSGWSRQNERAAKKKYARNLITEIHTRVNNVTKQTTITRERERGETEQIKSKVLNVIYFRISKKVGFGDFFYFFYCFFSIGDYFLCKKNSSWGKIWINLIIWRKHPNFFQFFPLLLLNQ